MIKILIALTSILILNGCTLSLPTVSNKSNAMLDSNTWQPINDKTHDYFGSHKVKKFITVIDDNSVLPYKEEIK